MKYPKPDHEKLLQYCADAPVSPHPDGWLVGIPQIARQISRTNSRTAMDIVFKEIHAIWVDGIWHSNLCWCPDTDYILDPSDPDGPGIPQPRKRYARRGRPRKQKKIAGPQIA